MTLSETRAGLLAQHEHLREILAACRDLGVRLTRGDPVAQEFERSLCTLRRVFEDHNRTEEDALADFLRHADVVGPRRVERMIEEHTAEHATLVALLGASERDLAPRLPEVSELLEAHMEAEERTFLSEAVLREAPTGPVDIGTRQPPRS